LTIFSSSGTDTSSVNHFALQIKPDYGTLDSGISDMSKCFAYLRVSGGGQVDGDGFERQLLYIQRYADQHGMEVAEVFREEGVSGAKDLADRPAFLRMLDSVNGVNTILIERLDRLARDLMVQESILKDMKARGIDVISATEPDLCGDDPTRKLIRQMLGAFAEYEKSGIVAKLRGARQRMKATTGRCEGQKPYGFHPGEAAVLEEILRQRDTERRSAKAIAEHLNDDCIAPRRGKAWHPHVVAKILRASGRVV
jgi:DNA invertase Pin-like site-specific DNA recombinase